MKTNKRNMPLITANKAEDFAKIHEALLTLPDVILDNIESARYNAVGIECIFRESYGSDAKIVLPRSVTQISYIDDFIAIYCDTFNFKIVGDLVNKKLTFIILEN